MRRTRLQHVRRSPTGAIHPMAQVLTFLLCIASQCCHSCAFTLIGCCCRSLTRHAAPGHDICRSSRAAWAAALADIDVAIAEKRCLDALNSIEAVPERVKMPDTSLM
jgi:hypothetical protein